MSWRIQPDKQISIDSWWELEKSASYGEVGTGEENGTEQSDGFHGGRIAFASISEPTLFCSHLEIQFAFFLGYDVVQLFAFHISSMTSKTLKETYGAPLYIQSL